MTIRLEPIMVISLPAHSGLPILVGGRGKPTRAGTITEVKDLILAAVIQNHLLQCINNETGAHIQVFDRDEVLAEGKRQLETEAWQ